MKPIWQISLVTGSLLGIAAIILWAQKGLDEAILFYFNPARIEKACGLSSCLQTWPIVDLIYLNQKHNLTMNTVLRSATLDDLPFLREMLFEAAYWRPDQPRPGLEDGLSRADLGYLLEDWGKTGDTAMIAFTEDTKPTGAAWYRFWTTEKHSYGFVAPHIPELAIGVHPAFRRKGIGNQLLTAILDKAAAQGVEKISLSVETANPALQLYLKHGFQSIQQNPGDWIMIAQTRKGNQTYSQNW